MAGKEWGGEEGCLYLVQFWSSSLCKLSEAGTLSSSHPPSTKIEQGKGKQLRCPPYPPCSESFLELPMPSGMVKMTHAWVSQTVWGTEFLIHGLVGVINPDQVLVGAGHF